MNNDCNKEWTRKFMVSVFTQKFINGAWKSNREKVLLEKEKALLPATQSVVEQLIEQERKWREVKEIEEIVAQMNRRRQSIINQINCGEPVERKQFIRACPEAECRGFLSTAWKCGLCEQWTCPDCHVIKGSSHTCHPDDLATAKLLDKDTKSCPKCATGIFKIEGCDQMWCTQCHTAFSWKSGHIETRIHNPHYYEWQRQNGGAPRVEGDIICGRELDHRLSITIRHELTSVISDVIPVLQTYVDDIIRATTHLEQVQMRRYRVNPVEDNEALRVAYLRNRITEDEFKVRVQRNNKQHEKNREMHDLLQLFVDVTSDVMHRLREHLRIRMTTEDVEKYFAEAEGIRRYTNACLWDFSEAYHIKPKRLRGFAIKKYGTDFLVDA